jgi:hypothetical protein
MHEISVSLWHFAYLLPDGNVLSINDCARLIMWVNYIYTTSVWLYGAALYAIVGDVCFCFIGYWLVQCGVLQVEHHFINPFILFLDKMYDISPHYSQIYTSWQNGIIFTVSYMSRMRVLYLVCAVPNFACVSLLHTIGHMCLLNRDMN